jgi:probable rRNA maturation factor
VLSFPQNEFDGPLLPKPGSNLDLLGDVVVSLDTAERQAFGRRRSLFEEVRFLLAHGVLHLLGYDHMTSERRR